jgi:hypothetical protein
MIASELYAKTQGTECTGPDECHWCGANCQRLWPHDEPPPIPFVKGIRSKVRRPSNGYVCTGCWNWRRKSITVKYADDSYTDRRSPRYESWWLVPESAIGLKFDRANGEVLYQILMEPPVTCCLSLVEMGEENHLQECIVNHFPTLFANTPFRFTLNGVVMEFTIYDLEVALRQKDSNGLGPGVGAITRLFGYPEKFEKKEVLRKRGGQTKRMEEDPAYPRRLIRGREDYLRLPA